VGTGLIGGQWLNRVLTEQGRADLSWKFVTNEDTRAGATWSRTAHDRLGTLERQHRRPAMNSGNHVMLVGDLIIWMYENLAGIQSDPAKPGFKHVVMKPYPVQGADFVRASYRSIHGPISSAWKVADGAFSWDVAVPVNATATVYVPAVSADAVTEGGKKASEAKGVKFVKQEGDRAVFEIESGSYQFKAPHTGNKTRTKNPAGKRKRSSPQKHSRVPSGKTERGGLFFASSTLKTAAERQRADFLSRVLRGVIERCGNWRVWVLHLVWDRRLAAKNPRSARRFRYCPPRPWKNRCGCWD
jgi:hypothetical protein